ncbi:lysylphosphatidylglycerol synthase transmembrane domain-containing protein [Candidatus Omnitrophota bacterium]
MNKGYKKTIRSVLTWIITAAIFIFLFSGIKLDDVLRAIRAADITLFVFSLLISMLAHIYFSTARYRGILKALGIRLSFSEVLIMRMGSLPIKGVLPLKAGEVTRVAYLKKLHNVPYARGAGSILLGYALSAFMLSLFVIAGLVLGHPEEPLRILSVGLLALLVLALILKARSFPEKQGWLKTFGTLSFYTLGFEGLKIINVFIIFKAMSVEIPPEAFFLYVPIALLISSLPVTVLGLGVREGATVLFFSGFAAPEALLGASLLVSFSNHIFAALLGLLFLNAFMSRLLGSPR